MPTDRITVPVGSRDRSDGEDFARTVVENTIDSVTNMQFVEFGGDEVTLKVNHTSNRSASEIGDDIGARNIERTGP